MIDGWRSISTKRRSIREGGERHDEMQRSLGELSSVYSLSGGATD
jgi:hypothetical protein